MNEPVPGNTSVHRRGDGESASLQVLIHGIFAITMTLLILDLHVPTPVGDGHLGSAVRELAPQAIAYFVGFAWLLTNWLSVRAYFRTFSTIDTTGTVLMLGSVALLSLTPVAVSVVAAAWGSSHDFAVGIRLSAALVGLAYAVHLLHVRHDLRTGRRPPAGRRWPLLIGQVMGPVLLSFALTFVSGIAAAVVLLADLFALELVESLLKRRAG